MKNSGLYLFLVLFLISSGCSMVKSTVRFEIKKEDPAVGLTLGWILPEEQLQKIVGDQFKPLVKDGNGFLMLFVASSPKYYLADEQLDTMTIAHIVIPLEGTNTINAPLSVVPKEQEISQTLQKYGFKTEFGKIEMNLKTENDSLSVYVKIQTDSGSIIITSTFLNNPGELKNIDSTTVTATNDTTRYFAGPESYVPVQIPSVNIQNSGNNWISKLALTSPPTKVWLNTNFVWDFSFVKSKE